MENEELTSMAFLVRALLQAGLTLSEVIREFGGAIREHDAELGHIISEMADSVAEGEG